MRDFVGSYASSEVETAQMYGLEVGILLTWEIGEAAQVDAGLSKSRKLKSQ